MKIVVKTFEGLESVLQNEMEKLGFRDITPLKRAVSFEGTKRDLYQANYLQRTALRVLQPIVEFRASGENELYKNVSRHNWSKYLSNKQTLAIDSNVNSNFFKHSKYVALKVKDAIVDQFRNRTGHSGRKR